MNSYDPISYWLNRGKTYYKEFENGWDKRQEQALVSYLDNIQFESVLEIGCGFGRISRVLTEFFNIKEYHAIDLSPHQIAKAKELVHGVDFAVRTIQEFETTKHYDLVLAVEVLLHVKPDEIEGVISRLTRLGKHLVHIDPIKYDGELQPHNFIHPYFSIYQKLGKSVNVIPIPTTGQHIIHCQGS